MRKRARTIVFSAVCLFSFMTGIALAANYLGSGHFADSLLYWKFNGTTSDAGGSYTTPASGGMSSWATNTDLSFIKVTDLSWDILQNVMDWGNTGWTGYAYICSTNGSCDNTTAWGGTYSWCSARINTYLLNNDTQNQRRNTMMHEAGHCYSLGHRSDSTSIMLSYQTSIITPNGTDKSLVNSRY